MDKENNKALVVYYSETGTTEAIAKKISQATGADLYRIEPEQPYSAADLDWQDDNSRSTKEMNDRTARPAIKNGKVNLDSINTVYLGYPIWWDQAPRVVNTFIETNDLSGKRIITFTGNHCQDIKYEIVNIKICSRGGTDVGNFRYVCPAGRSDNFRLSCHSIFHQGYNP